MTTRARIYAGVGFDRTGNALDPKRIEINLLWLQGAAASRYGGYTMMRTEGGWVDSTGTMVREPGVVFELLLPDGADAHTFGELVRNIFNQTSVLITTEQVSLEEVTHEPKRKTA